MYVCDIYMVVQCSVSVDQNILRDYYCYTQAREIGLPVYQFTLLRILNILQMNYSQKIKMGKMVLIVHIHYIAVTRT